MTEKTIPAGYARNARGHLVPLDQVREADKLRDDVVRGLFALAEDCSERLSQLRTKALADMDDLQRIAGDRYGVQMGGEKGNLTLSTYDGELKVERIVADRVAFTEEIHAAKALLDNCMERWGEGAKDMNRLRLLVNAAFKTNRAGQLRTADVLDLLRIEMDDAEWKEAMRAIKDSIQAVGTTTYVRFFKREGDTKKYVPLVLDLAGV